MLVLGILAYDKYTGELTRIPMVATYSLEIMNTGNYTIYETSPGKEIYERRGQVED